MQAKYFTESGHELSQQDLDDINRTTKRETVRNVLAAAGIASIAYFGYTLMQARKDAA